jgi:HEAT repeat protein
VEDVVAQEKRLIVSGASGMGKTTTLKWLTLVYAEKCLEGAERLIPLYIDLGRFRHGLFYDHALMIAHENGLEEEDFKELLDDGKLAIFLDGLDLLGGSEDFEPVAGIQNFMSGFSRCKFVLSSRPGFFEGFKSSCKVSELVELDDPKIKGYIHKYLGEGDKADTLINRIFDSRNERLKLLCKNPMMLHLVIDLQKDGKMADDRAGIYRESVEGIITHYREKGKTLSSNEQIVRDVLKELAFSMQKENIVRLDYGGTLDVAGLCISHERYGENISTNEVLDDCFGLGLLHKDGDEVRFEFHQSFQEYFAAVKLKEIFEQGYDISESFSHPKWEDTLIFLSEITKRPDELIDDVVGADKIFLAARLTLRVGARRVRGLCARLLDKVDSESDLEKYLAMESFAYIGDRGYEALMEVPISDWDELLPTFVMAFGRIGDKRVVEPLIDMLHNNSNHPTTQYFAILALGEIRAEGAVEPLINLLYGDPVFRGSAARALGKIGDKRAVEPLIGALNDDDQNVRRSAIQALGAIRDKRAVKPIIDALRGDVEVRDMAAETLGKIGDKRAVEPLIGILHGDGDMGREEAILALGEIGDEKAVEPITEALHGHPELRWCATIALGEIRDEKYIETSIEKIGDEKYIETLMVLLNSDHPRMQQIAIDVLKYRCGSKHEEKFKPLLISDREVVASAASEILHSIELKEQEKIKIFKELKKKPAPAKTKSTYITPSGVMDAEEMLADAHLGALIDRLKLVPDSITVVDYGCGKGAFLGRMKEIERELGKIHYIGVDISRGNRYLAGITAERYGVADKLKRCDFMKPDEFSSKDVDIDHVFFSHVLHEIRLKYLPKILHNLLSKMKAGSRITILEQVILLEPERDFVTWDADDFDMLFSGFAESSPRPYQTGRGHELISVDLVRLDVGVDLESMRERCLEVYKRKKERVGEERESSDVSEGVRHYLSELYANIDSQIIEYQKSVGLDE